MRRWTCLATGVLLWATLLGGCDTGESTSGGTAASGPGGGGTGGAGGTGGTGAGTTGGSGGATVADPVIDNMDDCNDAINIAEGRHGYWFAYNSICDGLTGTQYPEAAPCTGGDSAFAMEQNGADCAARTYGSGFPNADPDWGYAGIGFELADGATWDACHYDGIRLTLEGTPVRVLVTMPSTEADGDHFGINLTEGDQQFTWGELFQEGWGTAQTFECSRINMIEFQALDPSEFDFTVDDIEFLAGAGTGGTGGTGGSGGTGGIVITPGEANVPFGSHGYAYAAGSILPSAGQPSLDNVTTSFYAGWKSSFVTPGCESGHYHVHADTGDCSTTVSEAHGYGMMITALMAGHDPDAKTIFDGMYYYFRAHPSQFSPDLMAWCQGDGCVNASGTDAASDGDLDIAFALLLADKQWGSCGGIDYRTEATSVINAIGNRELDVTRSWVLLGDWVGAGGEYSETTRSSDFMPDHFASFAAATGGAAWTGLMDSMYGILGAVQNGTTGLVPDFIVNAGGSPAPAPAGHSEGSHDGDYHQNACRVPWRVGTHFLVSGDSRASAMANQMTNWIKSDTGGNPSNIMAGYYLGGASYNSWTGMSFTAPFGVAAMVDASHQAWLDAIWGRCVNEDPEGYYEDTIRMLSMLVMSGNWWSPDAMPDPCG